MSAAQNASCCFLSTTAKYPQPNDADLDQMEFFCTKKSTITKILKQLQPVKTGLKINYELYGCKS